MQLVVDASVLVGELLRERGRARLLDERLELYIAEPTWSEVRHELPRRQRIVAERKNVSTSHADTVSRAALRLIQRSVVITPTRLLTPFEEEARWRIPQDPNDWPSVALALAVSTGIWSEDRDFFGCGLTTWTTSVLDRHLVSA